MTQMSPEIEETEPQGKILFIDLQPLTKQNKRIATEMFGVEHEELDKYKNIQIVSIKAPKPSEIKSTSEREERATLSLPESVNAYKGIVITGSPFAAYPRDKEGKLFVAEWKYGVIKFLREAKEQNVPVLGICLGSQILAEAFGGKAVDMQTEEGQQVEEVGWGKVHRSPDSYGDKVLKDVEDEFIVPEHHGDVVAKIPEDSVVLAENEYGVQGFRIDIGKWHAWGFQFHAERNPQKVEELLVKQGKTEEEAKKMGESYTGNIKKIFNNFLRLSWSGSH